MSPKKKQGSTGFEGLDSLLNDPGSVTDNIESSFDEQSEDLGETQSNYTALEPPKQSTNDQVNEGVAVERSTKSAHTDELSSHRTENQSGSQNSSPSIPPDGDGDEDAGFSEVVEKEESPESPLSYWWIGITCFSVLILAAFGSLIAAYQIGIAGIIITAATRGGRKACGIAATLATVWTFIQVWWVPLAILQLGTILVAYWIGRILIDPELKQRAIKGFYVTLFFAAVGLYLIYLSTNEHEVGIREPDPIVQSGRPTPYSPPSPKHDVPDVVQNRSSNTVPAGVPTRKVSNRDESQASISPRPEKSVSDAQRLLNELGYDAGIEDGLTGPKTTEAIISFQRNMNLETNGVVSSDLLRNLQKAVVEPKSKRYLFSDLSMTDIVRLMGLPDSQVTHQSEARETWSYGASTVTFNSDTRRVTSWIDDGIFFFIREEFSDIDPLFVGHSRSPEYLPKTRSITRGSHKSAVLELHGDPVSIKKDNYIGYEKWSYPFGDIFIGLRTGQVQSWTDRGGLKVTLVPGANISKRGYFEFGSHSDDVIRLQGTPREINRIYGNGTEEWVYPDGKVIISVSDHKVLSWQNNGSLKVKR